MNGCIYCVTNKINGKNYIGQTIDFYSRKGNHKLHQKDPVTPLHCAMNKHGWDNFEWEILEEGIETQEELDKKECYWIEKLKTKIEKNGYNAINGNVKKPEGPRGRSGFNLSEDHKQKIAEKMKGEDNPRYGKPGTMTGRKGEDSPNWMKRGEEAEISQKYIIHNLQNDEIFEIIGIRDFCRRNNLNTGRLCWIARERKGTHKGYVAYEKEDYLKNGLRDYELEKKNSTDHRIDLSSKNYIVITPENEEIEVKNLIDFFLEVFPHMKRTSLGTIYRKAKSGKPYKGYYIKPKGE